MNGTDGAEVCLDYEAICRQAAGTLARRGVFRWIERDEVMSVGYLAVATLLADPRPGVTASGYEALAVIVARRAMIDAIRANEVRQRGREDIAARDDDSPSGDAWDDLIYSRVKFAPTRETDVWEAIKALPAHQYRVVFLTYWGGFTQAEIGAQLGIGQQHVARVLQAAKNNLREMCVNRKSQTMTLVEGQFNKIAQFSKVRAPRERRIVMPVFLSRADIGRRLAVCDHTVRQLVKGLPSIKIGQRIKYPEAALLALLEARTAAEKQPATSEKA